MSWLDVSEAICVEVRAFRSVVDSAASRSVVRLDSWFVVYATAWALVSAPMCVLSSEFSWLVVRLAIWPVVSAAT